MLNISESKNKKAGFTIIETMISISLFIVVVMAGMDSLLNANLLHQKSQDMRSILDSLTFVMDDMSKNIRTGYSYHCVNSSDNFDFSPSTIVQPKSCISGSGFAFENAFGDPARDDDQWIYKIESISGPEGPYYISKSTDSGATFVQLNPSEVQIDSFSGFSVLGAEPPSGDKQQPFVTIRLSGKIILKNNTTSPFSIQTSVSQRLVDL